MPTVLSQGAETVSMSEPLHDKEFNPNWKTITWERLENIRLRKLGLRAERYSRHFQRIQRFSTGVSSMSDQSRPVVREGAAGPQPHQYILSDNDVKKTNSVAPFWTVGKPTCGYFFSRETDNKKKKIGIPPTNLVKWRSFVQ